MEWQVRMNRSLLIVAVFFFARLRCLGKIKTSSGNDPSLSSFPRLTLLMNGHRKPLASDDVEFEHIWTLESGFLKTTGLLWKVATYLEELSIFQHSSRGACLTELQNRMVSSCWHTVVSQKSKIFKKQMPVSQLRTGSNAKPTLGFLSISKVLQVSYHCLQVWFNGKLQHLQYKQIAALWKRIVVGNGCIMSILELLQAKAERPNTKC